MQQPTTIKKYFYLGRTQIWRIQFQQKPQTKFNCVFKLVSEIDLYVSFCVFMGMLVMKQVPKFKNSNITTGKRTLQLNPASTIISYKFYNYVYKKRRRFKELLENMIYPPGIF